MKNCAFLTMDNLQDFVCYDELLYDPLRRLGWDARPISWHRRDIDWNQFDAVIIRSTWDYQKTPRQFIAVLEEIDRSSARLENSLALVKWNINKTYLQDLEKRDVEIVPTLWRQSMGPDEMQFFFSDLQTEEIIIKPLVSANADDTFRIRPDAIDRYLPELITLFQQRNFMVQPFMQAVVDEGEFSLFFFGGKYSHTILKTPKPSDFRVQEEHGGVLRSVEPDPSLLAQARGALHAITPRPLYARIDLVRTASSFAVMEIELIEPSLYFNMDAESPQRFAAAFNNWMNQWG